MANHYELRVSGLSEKTKKTIKYTSLVPVGIPSRSQAGRMKKKEANLPITPPRIGERPKICMEILWENGHSVKITALLDSGSSCCIIDSTFAKKWGVLTVVRDVPVTIRDFHGSEVKEAGEAFSYPLILRRRSHYSKDTFEIAPLDREAEVILPWWWMIRHKPHRFFEGVPSTIEFTEKVCQDRCTIRAMADFSLDFDDNLLESVLDISAVGIIGSVTTNLVGNAQINYGNNIPKKFRKFARIASKEVGDALPPHRPYDHAIDIIAERYS